MKIPLVAKSRQRVFVACFALASACSQALADLQLQCSIEQGGKSLIHTAPLVQDPYGVASIDVNGRFRFKAVLVGNAKSAEYAKVYVYDYPRQQPVLLQYAKYLNPSVQSAAHGEALTGVQTVYSARLGREMQYQCKLVDAAS